LTKVKKKNVKCREKRRQGGEEGRRKRKIGGQKKKEDTRGRQVRRRWRKLGRGEGRKGKEMHSECRRCRTRYGCRRSL